MRFRIIPLELSPMSKWKLKNLWQVIPALLPFSDCTPEMSITHVSQPCASIATTDVLLKNLISSSRLGENTFSTFSCRILLGTEGKGDGEMDRWLSASSRLISLSDMYFFLSYVCHLGSLSNITLYRSVSIRYRRLKRRRLRYLAFCRCRCDNLIMSKKSSGGRFSGFVSFEKKFFSPRSFLASHPTSRCWFFWF